jgi:hypothetical protein
MAILIMGSVVAFVVLGRSDTAKPPVINSDSPETCIARLQMAEERGDVVAYLDCFSATERSNLEKQWSGIARMQIAAELRNKSVGVMGRATANLKLIDADHAELVLEHIRQDSVDRQSITLRREDNHWKITSASASDRTIPTIPYGTPVDAQR